jgi:glycosyltransferase involved in cell wall biosynthesis
MNILMIGALSRPGQAQGGLNRYYFNLKEVLIKKGHVVECVFPDYTLPFFKRLILFRKDFKLKNRSFSPDIINSHFALYTFTVFDLIKSPIVSHFQGPWSLEKRAEGKNILSCAYSFIIENLIYKKSKHIICLSQYFKELLHKRHNIKLEKISVIQPGISEIFSQARSLKVNEKKNESIFCIRRLSKRMGIDNLIKAISILKKNNIFINLFIAGKGNQEKALRTLVKELNLKDSVNFLGFISDEDAVKYFLSSKLSVVPSKSLEGFGLIAAESLACGCPVLVTPVGALPEVVKELDANLIAKDSSPEAIAEKIKYYFQNDHLPKSETCRNYALEKFSWDKAYNKIICIFDQVSQNTLN